MPSDSLLYWIGFLLISLACGGILYQDLKARQFYLFWFLPLCVGSFCIKPDLQVYAMLFNLSYLLFLYIVLCSYLSIKNKCFVYNLLPFFALGDWIMLLIIGIFLSEKQFLITILASALIGIILYLLYHRKRTLKTVPFAGYIGLVYWVIYNYYFQ